MKKLLCLFLSIITIITYSACTKASPLEPQVSEMKAICELAVMDCYYHNVAKFTEEDAQGIWLFAKDKHFWIEYSGIVTVGIDVSLVRIEVLDTQVTITLPEAQVFSCKVDSDSLSKDSFIVDKNSARIEASDEVAAFDAAQRRLEEIAANDKTLLAAAQQRAQALLEDYVNNIGIAIGKEYSITWIYLDTNGKQIITPENVETSS